MVQPFAAATSDSCLFDFSGLTVKATNCLVSIVLGKINDSGLLSKLTATLEKLMKSDKQPVVRLDNVLTN